MTPIAKKSWQYFPILLLLMALISCQKNSAYYEESKNEGSRLKLIQAEYVQQQIDTALRAELPFELGVSVVWNPLWDKLTERIEKDSVTYFYIPLVAKTENSLTKTSKRTNTSGIQKYLQVLSKDNGFEFRLATYFMKDSLIKSEGKSNIRTFVSDLIVQDIKTKEAKYYSNNFKRSVTGRDYCRWIFYCDYYTGCRAGQITATVNESYCKCPDQYFRDCAEDQGCNQGAWFLFGYQVIEICEPDPEFPPEPPTPEYNIFARLEETNFQVSTYTDAGGFHEIHTYDTYLRFYHDQACSIPTGVDPAISFNYQGAFTWTTTANYGQHTGLLSHVAYAPNSASSSMYVGQLRVYQKDQYEDPDFGLITEETSIGWQTTTASNYEYFPMPTIQF